MLLLWCRFLFKACYITVEVTVEVCCRQVEVSEHLQAWSRCNLPPDGK